MGDGSLRLRRKGTDAQGGTLILNWQWRAKEHITLPLKSIDLEKLKKFLRWLWEKKTGTTYKSQV